MGAAEDGGGTAATARAAGGGRRRVANGEVPPDVPVRPMGDIAVLAHVVWADGDREWRAARAVRWTRTHVMVAWRDDPQDPRSERHEWLRADDVARSVQWLVGPGPADPRTRAGR
ncbi:hypothetical protein [Cellulomonas marina]|uniref:Uncharacterized protein n=1 Tax=Cellulomonas marina TaxID=988821 RepID=A0A1I0ZGK0_9CELL|nr:hypothetical protein [Cellulomonas marina]SFB24775.1 hypothetical protein SAMN05421867_11149 [Cellulomonas marina]